MTEVNLNFTATLHWREGPRAEPKQMSFRSVRDAVAFAMERLGPNVRQDAWVAAAHGRLDCGEIEQLYAEGRA